MSHTIAHRPHVHHIPLLPVLTVLAAVLIATAIIWAVAQPQTGTTTTTTGGEAIVAPVVHPAAVAPPESPVFRHALMRVGLAGGYERAFIVGRVHMVEGTTLDPVSTNPYGTAPYDEPNYPR